MKTLQTKRPDDRLDFDVDFSRWLTDGDTIAVVDQAEVTSGSGSASVDSYSFTATLVKVWLSGGVSGETVAVTVQITTAQGRTKEVCFHVRVRAEC